MKFPQLFVVCFTLVVLSVFTAFPATKTSTGSGNWNTAGTWSPSGVPVTDDDVIIAAGHTVTVDVNTASIGGLTIEADATLRGDGTNKVFSMGRDAGQDFVNLGTLDFGPPNQATVRLRRSSQWGGSTGVYRLNTLNLNGRTLSFTAGSTIQLEFQGSGNSIANAGTINGISTVVFNYNGTSAQLLSSSANVNYGTLWINNTAGVTLNRSLSADDMRGDLRVQSGTLSSGGYSITGTSGMTFEVADGATFNLTAASAMPTGFSTKTFGPSSTVEYSGATPQTVSVETYGNLTLNTGGAKTHSAGAMTVAGNFTVSGAAIAVASGAMTINGNVSIGSLASFNAGAFIHSVKGNWSNSGTFNTSTSTVNFDGTSQQSISATTFNNLTLNNPTGFVLTGNVTLPGTLTLTDGVVSTGANVLTLGTSTGTIGTLVRTLGWFNGNFRRWFATATVSNVLLPVGDDLNYRPATVSFTSFPSSGGTLTALFTNTDPGITGLPLIDGVTSIENCGIDGFWTLTAGNGLTGGVYSLDLTATGFFQVSDVTTLRILKRTGGASPWTLNGTHAAGTGTVADPVAHRTGMSGFSQFGIGGGTDNPLPIQLSYFSGAVSNQNNVRLTWGTVTETNNFGFMIQRRIGEEGEYTDIENSFVAGHGTTIEPHEYEWIHAGVAVGSYYYRLKQTDMDGAIHHTDAISIVVDPLADVAEEAPRVFTLDQNYPNPFNPSTTVRFTVPKNGYANLTIYNLLGQAVATPFAGEVSAGRYYDVAVNASGMPSGTYFYKLATSNGQSSVRRMTVLK